MNISDQISLASILPLDERLSNVKITGSNLVVESLNDYFARVPKYNRSFVEDIFIVSPEGLYSLSDIDAGLVLLTVNKYKFTGGVANSDLTIQLETDPVFTEWILTTPPAYPGDIPSIVGLLTETTHDQLDHTGLTGIHASGSDNQVSSDFEIADLTDVGGLRAEWSAKLDEEVDPIVGAIDGIVKADGNGNISEAVAMSDYMLPFDIYGTQAWLPNHLYNVGDTFSALEEGGFTSYNIVNTSFTSDATYNLTGKESLNSSTFYIQSPDFPSETDPVFAQWLSNTPPAYPGDIPSISGLLNETSHDLLDHTGLTGIHASGSDNQISSDFEIADLTDVGGLRNVWSGKQDSIPFVIETEGKFLRDDETFHEIELPSGGYANNLYFSEVASDVNGYETLTYTPDNSTFIESHTVKSSEGNKVFHTYLYPVGVSTTLFPSGLWSFNFYGKVDSSSGESNLGVTYFARHLDTSETDLFTVWSDEINNTTDAWIKFNVTQPTFDVVATDRMGARILAKTTKVSDINITYTVGDGYGAFLNNPNKIRHSQLRDLNGDTNYLHVTSAEKSSWDGKQPSGSYEVTTNKENTTLDSSTSKYPTNALVKSITDTRKYYHGIVARPVGVTNPLPTNITTTTFTLGATANPISYYYEGTLITVSSNKTATLDDGTSGLYYVYFNGATGNILATKSFPGVDITSNVIIATVVWNGSDYGLVNDERHGYNRDTEWHVWAHNTVGCRYKSGITLTHNGGTGNAATFATTSGEIADEDIKFVVNASSAFPVANAGRLFYQTAISAFAFVITPSTVPGYLGVNQRPYYVNSTGYVLTEMSSAPNRYINVFVYATTSLHTPIQFFTETISSTLASNNGYTSVSNARAASFPNLAGYGLSPEMKPIYRLIWRADGVLQAIDTTQDDYRMSTSLPMSGGLSSSTASSITFTPTGNLSSVSVQAAIEELDSDMLLNYPLDRTIAPGYFLYVSDESEITLDKYLEVGSDSILEIG